MLRSPSAITALIGTGRPGGQRVAQQPERFLAGPRPRHRPPRNRSPRPAGVIALDHRAVDRPACRRRAGAGAGQLTQVAAHGVDEADRSVGGDLAPAPRELRRAKRTFSFSHLSCLPRRRPHPPCAPRRAGPCPSRRRGGRAPGPLLGRIERAACSSAATSSGASCTSCTTITVHSPNNDGLECPVITLPGRARRRELADLGVRVGARAPRRRRPPPVAEQLLGAGHQGDGRPAGPAGCGSPPRYPPPATSGAAPRARRRRACRRGRCGARSRRAGQGAQGGGAGWP